MSDEELRDELVTLLVAGHETTATSLAWSIERLVRHPEMLERLRDEVAAGEDEYLDAVCKETLRLRPVLPIVARVLKEDVEIGGYNLPAGATVAPCIHLIHRRPDIYPEPRRFRPERFLEKPAGTYTWIPFGGGVRRCLGATFALFEMRQVLSSIVSQVELRPADGRERAGGTAGDHAEPLSGRGGGGHQASGRAGLMAAAPHPGRAEGGDPVAPARLRGDGVCARGNAAGVDRPGGRPRRVHQGRVLRQLQEQGGAVPRHARRPLREAPRGDRPRAGQRRGARGPGAGRSRELRRLHQLRPRVGAAVLRVLRLRQPQRELPPRAGGPPPRAAGADGASATASGPRNWASSPRSRWRRSLG